MKNYLNMVSLANVARYQFETQCYQKEDSQNLQSFQHDWKLLNQPQQNRLPVMIDISDILT